MTQFSYGYYKWLKINLLLFLDLELYRGFSEFFY